MWYLILSYNTIIDDSYINIAQFLYLQSSYIINRYCSRLLYNLIWHSVAHLNIFILSINLFCFFFTLLLCGIYVLSLFWSYAFSLSHRSYSFLFWPFIFSFFVSHYTIYSYIYYIFWIWLANYNLQIICYFPGIIVHRCN